LTTFKISKSQERTYYALGVFALAQLFIAMAIGVAVFVSGPNAVIGITALGVVVLLTPVAAFLCFRLFRASAGKDIYGYFVLTKRTLVVKRPGKPRRFFRRTDCTGFTPQPWKLMFQGKEIVNLYGPGMGHDYRRELGDTVARTWWPAFYQGAAKELVLGDDGYPSGYAPLEIRTIFPPGGDREFPLLAYGPSRMSTDRMVLGIIRPLFVSFASVLVLSKCIRALLAENELYHRWNIALAAATTIAILLTLSWIGGRAIWQVANERISGRVFLLSRRGMKVFCPGKGWISLRPDSVVNYAPETGLLRTRIRKPIRFALPLARQGSFSRLIYTSLTYWGVERHSDWDKHLSCTDNIEAEGALYASMAFGIVLIAVVVYIVESDFMAANGLTQSLLFGGVLLCGTLAIITCLLVAMYYAHSRPPIPLDTTSMVNASDKNRHST